MAGIKYNYALNEEGRLVSIKRAFIEKKEGHTYHCIGCGAGMIARLGVVRDWHFAHRGDEVHCGVETYIHKVAKQLIKEKFEKEETFIVGYYREVRCSDINSCPFANEKECRIHKLETFDLKKYYDTCDEEKPVGDYIADLLLTNSSKPKLEPVLIEIQVSHKSSQQKRDSGLRIIEIRIKNEEDIATLLSAPLVENPDGNIGYLRDVETTGFAKFYGFKKKSSAPEQLSKRSIQRFYLFRSGKAFVSRMEDFKPCRKAWTKDNDKAIFEASIDSTYLGGPSPYDFGYLAARQNGLDIKTCQFCKYHRNGFEDSFGLNPIFCCLYKKYGTPENPEPKYANECSYYREDRELVETIRKSMPAIVVAPNE